jgi:hypothetical protein
MQAAVFHGPGDASVDEVPGPTAGSGQVVIVGRTPKQR